MRKNSKTEQPYGASSPEAAATDSPTTREISPPKKRTKASRTTSRKTAQKKVTGKGAAQKAAGPRKLARKGGVYKPSDAEIRLRAYFIAERRAQLFLQGDPAQDWLDARQQLVEEAAQTPASGKSTTVRTQTVAS